MVRALASDRANQAFDVSVLPRRSERRGSVPDPHRPDTSLERDAKCFVIVANEIFRRAVPWKRFSDLPRQPVCTENSNSDIMVMQSAKDRVGMDTSGSLNWARETGALI